VTSSFFLLRSVPSAPTLAPMVASVHPMVSISFLFFRGFLLNLACGIFASLGPRNVYIDMLNNMVSTIDHVVMNHQNQTRTNGIWGHVRYIILVVISQVPGILMLMLLDLILVGILHRLVIIQMVLIMQKPLLNNMHASNFNDTSNIQHYSHTLAIQHVQKLVNMYQGQINMVSLANSYGTPHVSNSTNFRQIVSSIQSSAGYVITSQKMPMN
jgi:hypothetical protein